MTSPCVCGSALTYYYQTGRNKVRVQCRSCGHHGASRTTFAAADLAWHQRHGKTIGVAVIVIAALVLAGCAAIKGNYNPDTGEFAFWSRHKLENGYKAGKATDGTFYIDTCGGAVSTDRGPLESAAASLVTDLGQVGIGVVRDRLGGVFGSPVASPAGECTCSREQHIQAVIDDPSIVAEAMARR